MFDRALSFKSGDMCLGRTYGIVKTSALDLRTPVLRTDRASRLFSSGEEPFKLPTQPPKGNLVGMVASQTYRRRLFRHAASDIAAAPLPSLADGRGARRRSTSTPAMMLLRAAGVYSTVCYFAGVILASSGKCVDQRAGAAGTAIAASPAMFFSHAPYLLSASQSALNRRNSYIILTTQYRSNNRTSSEAHPPACARDGERN